MGCPVFQYVENQFNSWIKASNPAAEYKDKYFGDPELGGGIASKRGAIVDAIEAAITEADETGKAVDMRKFDYDAIFAC